MLEQQLFHDFHPSETVGSLVVWAVDVEPDFDRGSKDMHDIPPTTESLSPNSVDETFVWILNEKEPQALWTSSGPGTC
jgi:hypothetical protein